VKLSMLARVLGTVLVFTLLTSGCSSNSDDKQPKLNGPDNPNLKPVGRGLGGASGKPAGGANQAPVSKN
jgi:hypothetical protein